MANPILSPRADAHNCQQSISKTPTTVCECCLTQPGHLAATPTHLNSSSTPALATDDPLAKAFIHENDQGHEESETIEQVLFEQLSRAQLLLSLLQQTNLAEIPTAILSDSLSVLSEYISLSYEILEHLI